MSDKEKDNQNESDSLLPERKLTDVQKAKRAQFKRMANRATHKPWSPAFGLTRCRAPNFV